MEDKRVLPAGSYIGSIEDYGISESKSKQPQAFIKFKVNKGEGEGFANLTWFGGLSEKVPKDKDNAPAHYTVKTLLDCGFSGQEVEDLAQGIASGVIPHGKEMALEIEDNEYEGVTRSRIKWVNVIGARGPKKMSKDELAGKTNTSALRAMLLKEKQNRPSEEPIKAEDEVPF